MDESKDYVSSDRRNRIQSRIENRKPSLTPAKRFLPIEFHVLATAFVVSCVVLEISMRLGSKILNFLVNILLWRAAANKRVRHYVDGVLVRENPLDDPHSLKLRQLVIGNWGFTSEPRNFAGRMDELAVFDRALSDEEIANF